SEGLDPVDCGSLPPYPFDKTFLVLDGCFSKNIKQSDNGASWDFKVRVPDGQTTELNWDPNAIEGITIRIIDGSSEISPGQSISSGLHHMAIYACYGDALDLHPVINIDRPASILHNFTLSGNVLDDNLATLSYEVNEESFALPYVQDGYLYTFNQSMILADGDYVVEVKASDSKSSSKSVNFTIDNTAPDLNVTVLPYGQKVKVSIYANDANKLSMMKCKIKRGTDHVDGSTWFIRTSKSFDESFKFRDLDAGTYTVNVSMEDCVGNIATFSEDFEIIDSYPPDITQITIILPEDSTADSTFFRINVMTDEKVTLVYSLNGYNETDVVELEQHAVDGGNTLVVYATDLGENTVSEEITFDYVNGIVREDTIQRVDYYDDEPDSDIEFVDYDIRFVDCDIVIEEHADDSMPADEQETNVLNTENGSDTRVKKSPSFSSTMTILFFLLCVIVYRRK
ncbi:MAG: hypothetical protein MJB12_02535, partial [Firmicutes bacterium]|nr:hypothetical protein [Bacillota bacterium]